MKKFFSASLIGILLVSGCTTSLVTDRSGGVANIDFHSSPGVSLSSISIDDHDLGLVSTSADVSPGAHSFRAQYRVENERCDISDFSCEVEVMLGRCEGTVRTQAGRSYLVTIDGRKGLVVARLAAKGYFEFNERTDEPSFGHASCHETSSYTTFRRKSN